MFQHIVSVECALFEYLKKEFTHVNAIYYLLLFLF